MLKLFYVLHYRIRAVSSFATTLHMRLGNDTVTTLVSQFAFDQWFYIDVAVVLYLLQAVSPQLYK